MCLHWSTRLGQAPLGRKGQRRNDNRAPAVLHHWFCWSGESSTCRWSTWLRQTRAGRKEGSTQTPTLEFLFVALAAIKRREGSEVPDREGEESATGLTVSSAPHFLKLTCVKVGLSGNTHRRRANMVSLLLPVLVGQVVRLEPQSSHSEHKSNNQQTRGQVDGKTAWLRSEKWRDMSAGSKWFDMGQECRVDELRGMTNSRGTCNRPRRLSRLSAAYADVPRACVGMRRALVKGRMVNGHGVQEG